jgi:hypothetical protein
MNKIKLKYSIYLSFFIMLLACNPKDCFESTGTIIQKEITVADFSEIHIGSEVTMIIKFGIEQKVIVETGDHLIDDISVEVINGKLFLEDQNSCNFTRDYGVTKIYVTSPNITEIRSDTARDINSDGVLNYPNLTIISENFHEDALSIGDFNLTINSQFFKIVSNGASIFNIDGNTNNLQIGFFAGSSRFNGASLIANNVQITHKSTNDMLVNPQIKIEGDIFSLGDVLSFNQPSIINVTEHYTGSLIFN